MRPAYTLSRNLEMHDLKTCDTSFPGILQSMSKFSWRLQWRYPHDITAQSQELLHILQTLEKFLKGGYSI